jgi:CBS-domain-containing membrane protein
MPQDLNKLLDKIKASAVERCRDRLDTATNRARDLITTSNTAGENCKKFPPQTETHGVTSVLKRRHGL